MRRPIAELLEELRDSEEHTRLEAKSGFGKSALETIVAFSNEPDLGGGYLLFGVGEDAAADGGFKVTGVESPSRLSENIASECSTRLSMPVRPDLWWESVEGGTVLAAFVAEAGNHDKPIYISDRALQHGCFRRIGSADVKCRPEDLTEMYARRLGQSAEQILVAGTSSRDVDAQAVAFYQRRLGELHPGSEASELPQAELLVRLGAAKGDELTRAGLVLFGSAAALRQHLPAVRVDLVQVAGTAWVEDTRELFLEQLELRMDAVGAYRRAHEWLERTLPKTSRFDPGDPERKDETTVPSRVIREALVNAIIHRDYSLNEPILVVRYRDRVEIQSPGYSLANREDWGEAGSRARNPNIAEVFRDLNLAETKGTGIRMMRRRMLEAERRAPEFKSDRKANRFTAVLSLDHLLGDEDRAWLEQYAPGEHDLAARQALLCAHHQGRVANADLRDRTGLDTLAASEVLKRLRSAGLLEQHSDGGRARSYYVLAGRPSSLQTAFNDTVLQATDQGELHADPGELGTDRGELGTDRGELGADRGELEAVLALSDFSPATQQLVSTLGARPQQARMRAAIAALCTERPLRPGELAALLGGRNVKRLVAAHLAPMVGEGLLQRTSESPTDPRQAYRTVMLPGEDDAQGS